MGNSQNRIGDRVLPLAPKWHPVNKVGSMVAEASGGAVDVDTIRLIAGVAAAVAIIITLSCAPVAAPRAPKEKGAGESVPAVPVREAPGRQDAPEGL